MHPPAGEYLIALSSRLITNLAQDGTIPLNPRGSTSFDVKLLPLFIGEHFHKRADLLYKRQDIDFRPHQLNLTGVGTGNCQQALDQARKPSGFLQHAFNDLSISFDGPRSAQTYLAYAADCGKRCPELVGSVGSESPELFKRSL